MSVKEAKAGFVTGYQIIDLDNPEKIESFSRMTDLVLRNGLALLCEDIDDSRVVYEVRTFGMDYFEHGVAEIYNFHQKLRLVDKEECMKIVQKENPDGSFPFHDRLYDGTISKEK